MVLKTVAERGPREGAAATLKLLAAELPERYDECLVAGRSA